MDAKRQTEISIKILETPAEMEAVEELQRKVWTDSETEVVPVHLLITVARNGGVVLGAYAQAAVQKSESQALPMLGFVYGFPGLYFTPDGPRAKHCSHQLGVDPTYRNSGIGFALKRAQWQMVRHQGLDLITWTYDPLMSRNAQLNIANLGAVSSTYLRDLYGNIRDEMNAGLPSDRLQVDWWVNTRRVQRRLSRQARPKLDLAHFLSAGAEIINRSQKETGEWPRPAPPEIVEPDLITMNGETEQEQKSHEAILLVEIPPNFLALKAADKELAFEWRLHIRQVFEDLFTRGYLITDFVHLPGITPRSFYVLSHGESTL